MLDWFTRQNITFAIAVMGFLLSLASWVKDYFSQRKKFRCEILGIKSYADVTFINLMITNHSRVPIAITRISLLVDGKTYVCSSLPVLVAEHNRSKGGVIYDSRMEYSTPLPIQLMGLGAVKALVLFEDMQQLPPDDATELTLSICTNRGNPVEMKLPLPAGWASRRKSF